MLRNATSGLVSDRRFDFIDFRVASSEAGGAMGMTPDVDMKRSLTGSKPSGVNSKTPLNLRNRLVFVSFRLSFGRTRMVRIYRIQRANALKGIVLERLKCLVYVGRQRPGNRGVFNVRRYEAYGSQLACFVIEWLTRFGIRATNTTSFGALIFATTFPLVKKTYRALSTYSINPMTRLILVAVVAALFVATISTLPAAAQTNNAATGVPTISGVTEVGEALTANTDGISDVDGLTNVIYSYQWVRVDDGIETEITDATGSTHALVSDDAGTQLKVRVTFTDDANNAEEIESDLTDIVVILLSFESNHYTVLEGENVYIVLQTSANPPKVTRIPVGLVRSYGNDDYFTLTPDPNNPFFPIVGFQPKGTNFRFGFRARDDDVYDPDKGNFGILVMKDDFQKPPATVLNDYFKLSDGVSNHDHDFIIAYVTIIEDELDPDANNIATGQPEMSGTVQVGQTLTAEIGTIVDADGLPTESEFSYQWYLIDGTDEMEIAGATYKTYIVPSFQEGKNLKVKISFTDDVGYEESVTSAETAAILPEVPGAVQNFEAAARNTKVVLSWDAPTNGGAPTSYQYRQSDDGANTWGGWADVPGSDGATGSITVTGLTNDTEYTFQTRGNNSGGFGLESVSATATPFVPDPPGAPQNLQVTPGHQKALLHWDPPNSGGGPESYEYRQSEDEGAKWSDWEDIPSSDGGTTEHTVKSLMSDTEYSFQVRGINSGGDGSESQNADAIPLHIDPPGPPLNLTATAGDTAVTLNWEAPTSGDATDSYQYRHKKTGDADYIEWKDIPGSDSSTTSYTVTGLENGSTYTFGVRGINDGGYGLGGFEFPFAIPQPPAPGAPQSLTASAGNGEVTLTWRAPSSGGVVVGYEFRQSEDGGGSWGGWMDITNSDANTTSHTITGLNNGTNYTFEVQAFNEGGSSLSSNQASAMPVPPLPHLPTNLTATAGDAQVMLVWEAPTTGGPVTAYQCRQSTDGGNTWSDWTEATGSSSSNPSYTATPLANDMEYTFEVRSSNLGGDSSSSNQATATPIAPGLTVEFDDSSDQTSAVHSGTSDRPTVAVTFSESVATFGRSTPSIEITNAYVLTAATLDDTTEPNDWIFTLLPTSTDDISISFVADESCDEGGICTTGDELLEYVPQDPYVIEYDSAPIVIGAWVKGHPGADGTWQAGDYVLMGLRFDKEVNVTGSPYFEVFVGRTRRIAYQGGGTGSRELLFGHVISSEDDGATSVNIIQNSLVLNGGTIKSLRGSEASLTFTGSPYVTSVTILEEENGDYFWTHANPSEKIKVDVEFSETVNVNTNNGTPTIGIRLSSGDVQATYASGSGTDTLRFEYAVAATDGRANDGWVGTATIVPESLNFNGGTVRDRSNNDADPKHGGHHQVWHLAERYSQIDIDSFVYEFENSGNNLEFEVTLDQPNMSGVSVSYQTVDDVATGSLDYVSKSGTLRFSPGETSKTIEITLIDDSIDENSETFTIELSDPNWGQLVRTGSVGYIFDDD